MVENSAAKGSGPGATQMKLGAYRAKLLDLAAEDPHYAVDQALDLFDQYFPHVQESRWSPSTRSAGSSSIIQPPG